MYQVSNHLYAVRFLLLLQGRQVLSDNTITTIFAIAEIIAIIAIAIAAVHYQRLLPLRFEAAEHHQSLGLALNPNASSNNDGAVPNVIFTPGDKEQSSEEIDGGDIEKALFSGLVFHLAVVHDPVSRTRHQRRGVNAAVRRALIPREEERLFPRVPC